MNHHAKQIPHLLLALLLSAFSVQDTRAQLVFGPASPLPEPVNDENFNGNPTLSPEDFNTVSMLR